MDSMLVYLTTKGRLLARHHRNLPSAVPAELGNRSYGGKLPKVFQPTYFVIVVVRVGGSTPI